MDRRTHPSITRNLLLLMPAPASTTGRMPESKAGILKWSNTSSGYSCGLTWVFERPAKSLIIPTVHPFGTDPISESTNLVGSSKSTNQARKIARDSRSSVFAVRRLCSILSSSERRTAVIASCSMGGGRRTSIAWTTAVRSRPVP